MVIDGKLIAQGLYTKLKPTISSLKEKNIIPHLVIFLVGSDPASEKYVEQKYKKGHEVGITVTVVKLDESVSEEELLNKISLINNDPFVHGIIVQRPLPHHIDGEKINTAVTSSKDVDGFRQDSPFTPPLAEAAIEILREVSLETEGTHETKGNASFGASGSSGSSDPFLEWLDSKKIVVIGKGETGGKPIIDLLRKISLTPEVIDSKTQNPKSEAQNADILISAVGKRYTVTKDMVKKGAILICVGMSRGEDGKLHGDYEEEEISQLALWYTPIPGGVGPVNVAALLKNVVLSAEKATS